MHRLITIAKNTIRGFGTPAFNFLIIIFGIKTFGKTDWANLIEVMLWVFFSVFMMSWGNYDHLLRTFSKNPNRVYSTFFSNFFSRSILLPFTLVLFYFFPFSIALWSIVLILLIFCYNALQALVVYDQKFGHQLLAETLAFIIIISSILSFNSFSLISFLKIYCVATFVKLIWLGLQFPFWKEQFNITLSFKEFTSGLPFFILGLSGWFISKIDIYLVDFFLEQEQLAEYQLLITAFIMLQALAAFIVIPFTKHVYRLPKQVLQKLKNKLYLLALPLICLGSFSIWLIIEFLANIKLPYNYYIIGGLVALPSFFYTIDIMELLKTHKERLVIYISFFAAIINTSLILLLIKPYLIFGVLISVCITQWIVLFAYKLIGRNVN